MDLNVRLITPGHQLSTETLFRAIRSLEAIVQRASLDTLEEFFAHHDVQIGRDELGRRLHAAYREVHAGFRLVDARRGSWEIDLSHAVGGALGWVVVEIMKEVVKNHPGTKRLVDWLNRKTWKTCASKVAEEIEKTQHFGHLGNQETTIQIDSDRLGVSRV